MKTLKAPPDEEPEPLTARMAILVMEQEVKRINDARIIRKEKFNFLIPAF
jgi:hypothetical protein